MMYHMREHLFIIMQGLSSVLAMFCLGCVGEIEPNGGESAWSFAGSGLQGILQRRKMFFTCGSALVGSYTGCKL
jgi:hypothetical protein